MPLREVTAGDEKPLQEIADGLLKSNKIIVITGAGVSTAAGIPDFRSKDGLYNLIPDQSFPPTPPPSNPSTPSKKRKADDPDELEDTPSRKRRAYTSDDSELPPSSQSSTTSNGTRRSFGATRLRGQDLFHARVWNSPQSASTFYRFIASLRQQTEDAQPTITHRFLRTLRDGGRLMRCYTQNIDGLEARVGLSMNLLRGKGSKQRFMKKNFEAPLPERTENTDFDGGCEYCIVRRRASIQFSLDTTDTIRYCLWARGTHYHGHFIESVWITKDCKRSSKGRSLTESWTSHFYQSDAPCGECMGWHY